MTNHFTLLVRVSGDITNVTDHFGVSTEDAERLTNHAGLILDLTAPKLNYLMQKFGNALQLEVPST